ncbi:MAG: hypothetical protein E7673_06655, partial [Ruminococcaceae bacterium]|nr:hypothetical protein [Oscillospiraceae bacterium]
MRKSLLILVTALLFALSMLSVVSCNSSDTDGATDTINVPTVETTYELEGEIPDILVYNEELDLDSLSIIKRVGDEETKIPVTEDMIISGDTSRVGKTTFIIFYEGYTFKHDVSVKYEVIFMDGYNEIDAQYVLSGNEIIPPRMYDTEHMVFKGWSPAITDDIRDNVTYSAVYEYQIADIDTEITAQYGTTLGEIELPSNSAGAWQFTLPSSTVIEGVGTTVPFGVKFVLTNGEIVGRDIVNVNVTKRIITAIKDSFVTEFTYNGQPQIPYFEYDYPIDISKVIFVADGKSDYTSAGTYVFEFFLDDPNFDGDVNVYGTYVIKKAPVTVSVNSYTMSVIDEMPEISYSVKGFDFAPISELGITVSAPSSVSAGSYELAATVNNDNVDATIENGTLTVTPAYPDIKVIGKPIVEKDGITFDFNKNGVSSLYATYEDDSFEDFTFAQNPFGSWRWEKTGSLGDASDTAYLYKAIFTHIDDRYENLEFEIPVKVNKKTLYFYFSGLTVDYNGSEQGIIYSLYESADPDNRGRKYSGLQVYNYHKYVNAGEYNVELSVVDNNYEARGNAFFTINKIDPPEVNFNQSFTEIWNSALNLSKIALNRGYTWNEPSVAPAMGTSSYKVTYTPVDTVNYNILEGEFDVTVLKATATLSVNERLFRPTVVYSGEEFYMNSGLIIGAHTESDLIFDYYDEGGNKIPCILNVGTYKIVVTLPETEHYHVAGVETTMVVTKAKNNDAIAEIQNATYGDSIGVLSIPTSPNGTWVWDTESTTVGNAGVNTFVAKYTDTSGNYLDREVTVTVNVAKKGVKVPAAKDNVYSFVYTGEEHTLEFPESELYTVSDNKATRVNSYFAILSLTDPDNYTWEGFSSGNYYVSYRISRAENAWTTPATASKTEWTYLDASATFGAAAKFGSVIIEYTGDGITYSSEIPTTAGKYTARFTVLGTDDYFGLTDTIDFTINKKVVSVPAAKDNVYSFVYTGTELTLEFPESVLYTVSNNKATVVNSYKALLTLTDPANYTWETTAAAAETVDFAITKAQAVIKDLALSGWVYGTAAGTPTATTNFGTIAYSYYENGAKLSAKP